MPAARPSKSSILNVLAALKEAGYEPGEIVVRADGGFSVPAKKPVDPAQPAAPNAPRKWGKTG